MQKFSILDEIKARHLEILRRRICGETNVQIARDLGVSPSQVYQVVNSPLFKHEMANVQKRIMTRTIDLQERVNRMAQYALKTQFTLMLTSPNDRIKLDASERIWEKSDWAKSKLQDTQSQQKITIGALVINAYELIRESNPDLPNVTRRKCGSTAQQPQQLPSEDIDI